MHKLLMGLVLALALPFAQTAVAAPDQASTQGFCDVAPWLPFCR